MMRGARSVGPGRPPAVVALAANVDVRIVRSGKIGAGGERIIIRRMQRIDHLRRVCGGLVRIMADDTGDGDIIVVGDRGKGLVVDQRQPDGAGMAPATTVDIARR